MERYLELYLLAYFSCTDSWNRYMKSFTVYMKISYPGWKRKPPFSRAPRNSLFNNKMESQVFLTRVFLRWRHKHQLINVRLWRRLETDKWWPLSPLSILVSAVVITHRPLNWWSHHSKTTELFWPDSNLLSIYWNGSN